MARKPKSVIDIDKEIETLKVQRVAALENRAEQIGKIAARADLNIMEISDTELLKEFQAIAERFRHKATASGPAKV